MLVLAAGRAGIPVQWNSWKTDYKTYCTVHFLLGIVDTFYPNKVSFHSVQWENFLNNVDCASTVGADAAPVTPRRQLALVRALHTEVHVGAWHQHHLRQAVPAHAAFQLFSLF